MFRQPLRPWKLLDQHVFIVISICVGCNWFVFCSQAVVYLQMQSNDMLYRCLLDDQLIFQKLYSYISWSSKSFDHNLLDVVVILRWTIRCFNKCIFHIFIVYHFEWKNMLNSICLCTKKLYHSKCKLTIDVVPHSCIFKEYILLKLIGKNEDWNDVIDLHFVLNYLRHLRCKLNINDVPNTKMMFNVQLNSNEPYCHSL